MSSDAGRGESVSKDPEAPLRATRQRSDSRWGRLIDYAVTFGAEAASILMAVYVVRLTAGFGGEEGVGAYTIVRRTVSLTVPVISLGASIALSRFVSAAVGGRKGNPQEYFIASVGFVTLASAFVLVAMNLARNQLGFILFGAARFGPIVTAASVLIAAFGFHVVFYSYFRGLLRFRAAGVLQTINIAVLPVMAFSLLKDLRHAFLSHAAGIVVACAAAVVIARPPIRARWNAARARELWTFGAQRLFGELGLMTFMALPTVVAAHAAGLTGASDVGIGMMLITLLGTSFAPFGVILLPESSQLIASGRSAELRRHVARLLMLLLPVTLCASVVFAIFAPRILRLYLGSHFHIDVGVVRILAFGGTPYAIFMCLAGVIDVYYARAVNVRNILVALGVFLLAVWGLTTWMDKKSGVAAATTSSLWVLGIVTLLQLRSIFRALERRS